jgi:hypothetical protein
MGKVAIFADVHIGNHKINGGPTDFGVNARCRATLDVFGNAMKRAYQDDCQAIICAGDLFDTANPRAMVLAATAAEFNGEDQPPTYLMTGNHDQASPRYGDNALTILDHLQNVMVMDGPPDGNVIGGTSEKRDPGTSVLFVPFDPNIKWDPKAFGASYSHCSVLITHVGIETDATPPWLAGKGVRAELMAEIMDAVGAKVCLSGDWHTYQKIEINGKMIYQIGALVPTGWDNPGLDGYGSLLYLDTQTLQVTREVLPGPRFVKTQSANEALQLAKKSDVFVRLITDDATADAACLDHENITVQKPSRDHRQLRASYAGNSVPDAVKSYCQKLDITDAVRDRVLARCEGFIQ